MTSSWTEPATKKDESTTLDKSRTSPKISNHGLGALLGPALKKPWHYNSKTCTRGRWNDLGSRMTDIFAQSEHPVFPASEKFKDRNIGDGTRFNFFTFHGRRQRNDAVRAQLCVLPAIAHILDARFEDNASSAEDDLNGPEMEALRSPPDAPQAAAGRRPRRSTLFAAVPKRCRPMRVTSKLWDSGSSSSLVHR